MSEEIYNHTSSLGEVNSDNEVNTANFSPGDLQMFVDSLETIARLERVNKLRRKQKRKVVQRKKRQVTCLDCSSCSSIYDDDLNSFSDDSFSSDYLYDDGVPVEGQSTAIYSNLMTDTHSSSDSEDSGIFVSNYNSASHLYENIQPTHSHSDIVTETKYKSMKSRLLAIIKKKQHVKPQLPSLEILSSTTFGEQIKDAEICEPHQLAKSSKKPKNKSSESKPEHRFLEKAMRLLSL